MVTSELDVTVGEVPWNELKPYMSAIVLRCVGDPVLAFGALVRLLKKPAKARQGTTVRTVAESGLSLAGAEVVPGVGSLESLEGDQFFGCVRRQQSWPGWVLATSGYVNVSHELIVALRRDELIAVRADRNVLDRLQKELDKPPRPPLRRLGVGILEEAFMQGAAKNIWTRSITTTAFQQHPDYAIITSFPGLADLSGARVFGEIGDDRARFTDARSLKAYAGSAPITRASGRSISITRRTVKNDRLNAAGFVWAFASIGRADAPRDHYHRRRAHGDRHAAALRHLFNRFLGQLHHCLQTGQTYDPVKAFGPALDTPTGAAA